MNKKKKKVNSNNTKFEWRSKCVHNAQYTHFIHSISVYLLSINFLVILSLVSSYSKYFRHFIANIKLFCISLDYFISRSSIHIYCISYKKLAFLWNMNAYTIQSIDKHTSKSYILKKKRNSICLIQPKSKKKNRISNDISIKNYTINWKVEKSST